MLLALALGCGGGASDREPSQQASDGSLPLPVDATPFDPAARDAAPPTLDAAPLPPSPAQPPPPIAAPMGRWIAAPDWPVSGVNVHLLPTGKVLFFSEYDDGVTQFLWDPTTRAVTALPALPYNPFCAGGSLLGDGKLLVAGGFAGISDTGAPSAALLDPATLTWDVLPAVARWYPTVVTLANGDAMVISGEETPGVFVAVPQVLAAATRTWRDLAGASKVLPLYPRAFVAPAGEVFVAGPGRDTVFIDPGGSGALRGGPRAAFSRREGAAAMYGEGKILAVGGGDPPTATAEVIDLTAAAPAWRPVEPMSVARRQLNATVLADGGVLVTGGSSGAGFDNGDAPVLTAELWDPGTERWTPLASSGVYRGYHSTALLLPDASVLAAGGRDPSQAGALETRVEVFLPPYLFRGARPVIGRAPAEVLPATSFTVATPDPSAIAAVTLVRLGSVTHGFDMNTRFLRLAFAPASGGLRVIAPQSNAVAPAGDYMLFLLSREGVPSLARMIRIGVAQ